jgi:predicted outer membrane protein
MHIHLSAVSEYATAQLSLFVFLTCPADVVVLCRGRRAVAVSLRGVAVGISLHWAASSRWATNSHIDGELEREAAEQAGRNSLETVNREQARQLDE